MRNPATPDCSISGCTRAAYKGFLCSKHYAMVPPELSGYRAAAEAMIAAHKVSRLFHKKQLAAVRKLVREA